MTDPAIDPPAFGTPPAIELPRGGGAIRGMGEKFGTDPVRGTGSMTVPLGLTPGRGGFGPVLSLTYDSSAGNGPFGFGWTLGLPTITRKTDKGLPRYQDDLESDVYILSRAEDLVPMAEPVEHAGYAVRRYRPRVEGLFARIERWTDVGDGRIHWRSISRDNVITEYGSSPDSRIADPADPSGRVFSWLISRSLDSRGNAVVYEYAAEDDVNVEKWLANERNRERTANRYLRSIKYGNVKPCRDAESWQPIPADPDQHWLFQVVLDYDEGRVVPLPLNPDRPAEEQHQYVRARIDGDGNWPSRPDPFSTYRAGFEVRTYRRCRRVLMFHQFPELGPGPCLARSTDLDYADFNYGADSPFTTSNPEPQAEAEHDGSTRVASYLRSVVQAGYVRQPGGEESGDPGRSTYLRRELPPLEFRYSKAIVDPAVRELTVPNLPAGVDGTDYRFVDLDGEGVPGVLTEQAGGWFYLPNRGAGRFGPQQLLTTQPNSSAATGATLLDLSGGGRLDSVQLDGSTPGFYQRSADSWRPFTSFAELPGVDWTDANLRLIDLTGDGLADVLVTEDGLFSWHDSLGDKGFGPAHRVSQALDEERGPRVLLADPEQTIYLADMSGDGLNDIVRVRNGDICYWPNLGYGRFGAKVRMDDAPWLDNPDHFDQSRVRLADIDGSGTTDLIYLGGHGPTLYANQSGNRWGPGLLLDTFPLGNDPASVTVADLLGNGTACLVWSSPLPGDARGPLRYIDLMGGQKPHLLVHTTDHLGSETRYRYRSSTQFYLADQRNGRPWRTRIPFPVHVVARIETHDHLGRTRLVTRFDYHDGYYDGVEREFRGFGRVDQWDAETFTDSEAEPASYAAPKHIRSWFHTGAEPDEDIDNPVLVPELAPADRREAYRAMAGTLLRQEVYGEDGSELAGDPYTVTEQRYEVRELQPRGADRHGVFYRVPAETLTYQYERGPAEPRVRHNLNLDIDEFGNVLRYVAVGYGRCRPDASLDPLDQQTQARDLISYTVNEVTNPVDDAEAYRLPMPAGSDTFELTGLPRPPGTRFDRETLRAAIEASAVRDYHEPATAGVIQRRRIEALRTVYQRDDLAGPLPHRRVEALGLTYRTYKLAFTAGLIADVYAGRVDDDLLRSDCGYVQLDDPADWWIPSGRVHYSPGPEDSIEAERAEARGHFYLPRRYRDPMTVDGRPIDTVVSYDYDLLVRESVDAMGNRVTAGERDLDPDRPLVRSGQDYRLLKPVLLMDANRNRTATAVDALGFVAGSALMGPPEADPVPGDRLDQDFRADLTPAEVARYADDPIGRAAELLGSATTRIVYDLSAYRRRGTPVFSATITRTAHVSDEQDGLRQLEISYSDGLGRQIQKKALFDAGGSRWSTTGWTVYNNKGNPVRRFEPFFSDSHHFSDDARHGVSVRLYYDALDRVQVTLYPDHSWSKTWADPWQRLAWDRNDTAAVTDPRTDPDVGAFFRSLPDQAFLPGWIAARGDGQLGRRQAAAAAKTARHADTPSRSHLDPLGREFLTVVQNRSVQNRSAAGVDEFASTRIAIDVEGNKTEITDALGRVVMRYRFDIAGNQVHQASMEGGARWTLQDVGGRPILGWDSRDQRVRTRYDRLHRQIGLWLSTAGAPEVLVGRSCYGEAEPDAERRNLRTRLVRVEDQAGVTISDYYDFKGNRVRTERRFAEVYDRLLDWSEPVALEEQSYRGHARFDALNRAIEVTAPDGSRLRPRYGVAGLLRGVDGDDGQVFVADIDYDAKGQRRHIEYGNGVVTRYEYDPATFRLTRLHTVRPGRKRSTLQDLRTTYDPMGNPTHLADRAGRRVFFGNRVVEPDRDYTYDALYRLIEATGREHLGLGAYDETDQAGRDRLDRRDDTALGRYRERYDYDPAGNLRSLVHHGTDPREPGWTKHFHYAEASQLEPDRVSNRLTAVRIGQATEVFSRHGDGYDPHGAMQQLPHLRKLEWDFRNQLRMTRSSERTWYVYDAGGRRVRKITQRKDGSIHHERRYLGPYEVFHRYGHKALTRTTLQVMDDKSRVALIERRTHGRDRAPATQIRYQLADALGSVAVEVDDRARIISYEEYSPYGSTTLQLSAQDEAPKRYRFTGAERDEETGFGYHGARYYAPWLCRWTSADPIGVNDGPNSYSYVNGRPTRVTDPTGTQSYDPAGEAFNREFSGEWDALIEGIFGGHAHTDVAQNTVHYEGPENGVGGMVGGVIRTATLRIVPVEDNPTVFSLMGMETSSSMVMVLDPAERLVTGTTVTGQDTSRVWAGVNLIMDVAPFAAELHAASVESRSMSMMSRMGETDLRLLGMEADSLDQMSHIGAGANDTRPRTITNPTGRDDLCVADVGAHHANEYRAPGTDPITNTDIVAASGRDVNKYTAPIESMAEARDFLNNAYASLYEQGRITQPLTVTEAGTVLEPGEYLAMVDGETGGHALHVTVSESSAGQAYIYKGKFIPESEALDLIADGEKVNIRNVKQTEFYDPQNGVCVQPDSLPRAYLRLR
ncbi:MAG TPA: SpvB/TcaC N-terminal domain-containing protein [Jatrophihabitans sp.]|nr:SpvB/TcaC N-terminal domain-containing protein [Jatrophihabitans sp.]